MATPPRRQFGGPTVGRTVADPLGRFRRLDPAGQRATLSACPTATRRRSRWGTKRRTPTGRRRGDADRRAGRVRALVARRRSA